MFNLNENNRFVMAQQPSDMRAGVNKLCGPDFDNGSPKSEIRGGVGAGVDAAPLS